MVVIFIVGAVLGALAMLVPLQRAVRRLYLSQAERQQALADRQRVIDFMHHMASALSEGVTRQELNQRIVHASILSAGALSGCLFQKTGRGTLRGVAVEGLFPPHRPFTAAVKESLTTRAKFIAEVLKSEEFPMGEGIVGRVAQTLRAELIEDASRDPAIVRHDDPALAIRSVIAVPMVFRDEFFGVLVVANPVEDRPFTATEFSLIESLGEQAALALHNLDFLALQLEKKQMDMDLSLASGIQQMLLPKQTADFAGLDLDARYLPAQKVGGDLYDIIPLSPTLLGIAVADVSGKGIPASLLMAICRTNLRQIAPRADSPAAVLSELNRVLAADIKGDLYVTMLYCVIDLEKHTVTLARAGHELPLFARRDGVSGVTLTRLVYSEGMPLGLVGESMFREVITDVTEPFEPGDILVLYTDGVTEAPNEEDKEFSGSRLADSVRTAHRGSAREINDAILAHVERFVGETAQRDDLTLVTVRCL